MARKNVAQPGSSIQLGPFDLHEIIGRGGMGEVWRGTHRQTQVPVAVKVIGREEAKRARFSESFRTEVQAIARMNHPGVVLVFEYGQIDKETVRQSQGQLIPDCPFLVMELLTGGSLANRPLPSDWVELRNILLSCLDALAYVHGRGVIHRDLKPHNILVGAPDDVRPGLRLIDFGIAALGRVGEDRADPIRAGTPAYQAPEQWAGWRLAEQGPWTDLYALGCTAYYLLSGRPPFRCKSLRELSDAHLQAPIPSLTCRFAVPAGLGRWLKRVLAKEPHDRFLRAADAAYALNIWTDSEDWTTQFEFDGAHPVKPHSLRATETTQTAAHKDEITSLTEPLTVLKTLLATPVMTFKSSRARPRKIAVTGDQTILQTIPPTPLSWHRRATPQPSMQLLGTGLGLYGLRTIPLIDRNDERDRLWDGLHQVRKTNQARLIVVRGPSGTGKSRLAQWFCDRSHEVGAAIVLRAIHNQVGGPADGISRMVARHLNCVGSAQTTVISVVQRFLSAAGINDELETRTLTSLVMQGTGSSNHDIPSIQFSSPKERHNLVSWFFDILTQIRPVVVWFDDIQWGPDALGLVQHVLSDQLDSAKPVLFVLTCQDEAIAQRPYESELLSRLVELDVAESIDLKPLGSTDHFELVSHLLGFDRSLANELVERTNGNPLFAVHLVGDWIRRGVLRPAESGFQLQTGEYIVLPDDIHQVWAQRTELLISETNASVDAEPEDQLAQQVTRSCLELAAVLGRDIELEEWSAGCLQRGTEPPETLVDTLISSRLATPTESGFAFVHGMFQESLVRGAREAGRWVGHNRACAEMLLKHYPTDDAAATERAGRHWLAAGDLEKALEPLLTAVESLRRLGDCHLGNELLDLCESALDKLPDNDFTRAERARGWNLRSVISILEGQFDRALELAENAAEVGEKTGRDDVLAMALYRQATVATERGELDKAYALVKRAGEHFARVDDQKGVAACWLGRGWQTVFKGELNKGRAFLEKAFELAEQIGAKHEAAQSLHGMASASRLKGDWDLAWDIMQDVRARYEDMGSRERIAAAISDTAEITRLRGEYEEAEKQYLEAARMFRTIGGLNESIALGNAAMCQLARGETEKANRNLLKEKERAKAEKTWGHLFVVRCLLLACAASLSNWKQFDGEINALAELRKKTQYVDIDIGWAAQLAGQWASEKGELDRAGGAYELAHKSWSAMGDVAKTDEVKQLLKELRSAAKEPVV